MKILIAIILCSIGAAICFAMTPLEVAHSNLTMIAEVRAMVGYRSYYDFRCRQLVAEYQRTGMTDSLRGRIAALKTEVINAGAEVGR
jgi:hypothetical protein